MNPQELENILGNPLKKKSILDQAFGVPSVGGVYTPGQPQPTVKPFKFSTTETQQQKIDRYKNEASLSQEEARKANSVLGFAKNVVSAPQLENLPFIGGALALSKTLNKIIDNPSESNVDIINQATNANVDLLKSIREKKITGEDTSKLERIFNDNVDAIEKAKQSTENYLAGLPSNKQALGQTLRVGADILSVGSYKNTFRNPVAGSFQLAKPNTILPTVAEQARQTLSKKAGLLSYQGAKNVAVAGAKGSIAAYPFDVAAGVGGGRGKERTGLRALIPGKITALGGIFGAGLSAATGVENEVRNAWQTHKEKAASQLDDYIGKVVQGKKEDIQRAKAALSQIDTKNIKNYSQLKGALDGKIEGLSEKLDEALGTDKTLRTMDDLALTKEVGGKAVIHNYVDDALNQLKELYTKTNDPENLEQINQLLEKANNEGLTVQELNNLAKNYGMEFSQKAFSKTGEPLTSVSAQALENTRSGVKATARDLFKNPIYAEADGEISNLIKTRDLVDGVAKKVTQLQQKVQERSLGEKVGRLVYKLINTVSLGSFKGFVEATIPRGQGLKTLNALDLDRMLSENLDTISNLLDSGLPEETIINRLQAMIDSGGQSSRAFLTNQSTNSMANTALNILDDNTTSFSSGAIPGKLGGVADDEIDNAISRFVALPEKTPLFRGSEDKILQKTLPAGSRIYPLLDSELQQRATEIANTGGRAQKLGDMMDEYWTSIIKQGYDAIIKTDDMNPGVIEVIIPKNGGGFESYTPSIDWAQQFLNK